MWGLGCLIWETYNGPLTSNSQLKVTDKVCFLYTYRMNIYFEIEVDIS